MKNVFLFFTFTLGTNFLATTSFGVDHKNLELQNLSKGSVIGLKTSLLIAAGEEVENINNHCQMNFTPATINRKFTVDHKLILSNIKKEMRVDHVWKCDDYIEHVWATGDIVYYDYEDRCGSVKTDVAYYTLTFDVLKKGVTSKSSPVIIVCADQENEKMTIGEFQSSLNNNDVFKLKIKDGSIDF